MVKLELMDSDVDGTDGLTKKRSDPGDGSFLIHSNGAGGHSSVLNCFAKKTDLTSDHGDGTNPTLKILIKGLGTSSYTDGIVEGNNHLIKIFINCSEDFSLKFGVFALENIFKQIAACYPLGIPRFRSLQGFDVDMEDVDGDSDNSEESSHENEEYNPMDLLYNDSFQLKDQYEIDSDSILSNIGPYRLKRDPATYLVLSNTSFGYEVFDFETLILILVDNFVE